MVRHSTALLAAALVASAASAQSVNVGQSSAPWIGFMNVFELPENGGGFVFASGWGVPDLTATFNDGANTLTLGPNTIGDPNQFWYQNTTGTAPDPTNPGGPGQRGNKLMEANVFQQVDDGSLSGVNVTFSGTVLSNSFTAAHEAFIFIRDFAPDFSSFNESSTALTPGAFSINLATNAGAGRHIQWGFQVRGENVWAGDEGPFGTAVIATVPTPASAALLGLGGLVATRRRRA